MADPLLLCIIPSRLILCGRFLCLVDEKVHPVEVVDFTDTGICIQEKQVELGVYLTHPFLHTFGHYVVGNAAKRLQAQHIGHAVIDQSGDLAGNQPMFAVLVVQTEDSFAFCATYSIL